MWIIEAFPGETLWPRYIGHFFILTIFFGALLSTLSFLIPFKVRKRWLSTAFLTHSISVWAAMALIFFVMFNHMYEYYYAYNHVSDDLPMQYIFSAFWEGQEGSFLLWMFWHTILGLILLTRRDKWSYGALNVLSGIQLFFAFMLLGVYLPDFLGSTKLGSNPMLLLRETANFPILESPQYLNLIKGQGLNELLQNYWNVIHPPVLFLGFSLCAIPFSYTIAGLFQGDLPKTLRKIYPWSLMAAAALGLGLLMGSAWAYEALSFGGYWAWDPVENASLVPWMVLVAGLHLHMIAQNTGRSVFSALICYLLTFLFVVYSTFLTRSGILGDTSAHAFTEMGLENQLVLFLGSILAVSVIALIKGTKHLPSIEGEESWLSREFWMFIGSLVLVIGAFMIIWSTSLPVINKIVLWFDPEFEKIAIADRISHYNSFQLWVALLILLSSAISIYFKYRTRKKFGRRFLFHAAITAIAATLLTYITTLWINATAWQYILLIFAIWVAVVANFYDLFSHKKSRISSSLSHIGFGILILGVLASGLNKRFLSSNPFAQRGLLEEERLDRSVNIVKGLPFPIEEYEVTYLKDTFEGTHRNYTISFVEHSEPSDTFMLYPYLQYDKQGNKVAATNPSIKRGLARDIFTNIAGLPPSQMDVEEARAIEESIVYTSYSVSEGDTIQIKDALIEIEKVRLSDTIVQQGDLGLFVDLSVTKSDSTFKFSPGLVLRDKIIYRYPVHSNPLRMRLRLPDSSFYNFMPTNIDETRFDTLSIYRDQPAFYDGYKVEMVQLSQEVNHSAYEPQPGDIAAQAVIRLTDSVNGITSYVHPVYLYRDNLRQPLNDYNLQLGMSWIFADIIPEKNLMKFVISNWPSMNKEAIIEVSDEVSRDDFIVLEVIEFPGISLVWLGSLMMLGGLSWRWKQKLWP